MKPNPLPRSVRPAAAIALLLLAGCRSFDSRWQAAGRPAAPGIAGRWTGTWQNTNNTHHGALRALIEPADATGTNYVARFHATWGGKSGGFKTRLTGSWSDDTFRFTGRRRILGVPITTSGAADSQRFEAGYDSPFDVGTFTLTRPDR